MNLGSTHSTIVSFVSSLLGQELASYAVFLVYFLACFIVLNIMALIGGLGTYAERKISADMQLRMGPNRVGPYGLLQFLADGVKMIMKENTVPRDADRFLYTLAPIMCMLGVFSTLAVLPFSKDFVLTDLNIGVFYLIGISSLVGVGIFLGGYASNSKWSMLGGMRGASQIVSYEIPVVLSILSIVLIGGDLSLNGIISGQKGGLLSWNLFHNPFTFFAFIVYFIGALAEANRAPFDLPEAESELVSGYHTEYSGMRFAFFALAEYVEVFVLAAVASSLFLGGYLVPFGIDTYLIENFPGSKLAIIFLNILQVGIFFGKAFFLYYLVIAIRWTLPRLRVDQLMVICWKYLTPIAMVNIIGCGVWLVLFDGQSFWEVLSNMLSNNSNGHH